MRDAIGGVFNITFVAIFIVVISGYLAFTISYSKAFKVKNKIISVLEQYQGYSPAAQDKINIYIKEIGYNTVNKQKEGWDCQMGYCVKWNDETSSANSFPTGYYSVITYVQIDLPIFNKFLPFLNKFQTTGDTMTIRKKS